MAELRHHFDAPVYEEERTVSPGAVTVRHNGVLLHHCWEILVPTSHKRLAKYPESHCEAAEW